MAAKYCLKQVNFVQKFAYFKDDNRFLKVCEPCENVAFDTYARGHTMNTQEFGILLQP